MDIFHFTREKKERKKKREREGGEKGIWVCSVSMASSFSYLVNPIYFLRRPWVLLWVRMSEHDGSMLLVVERARGRRDERRRETESQIDIFRVVWGPAPSHREGRVPRLES